MTENRYRAKSPPRSRGYHDPRSSAGTFYSSSFDPGYGSQPRSAIEPYQSSRHGSIYDTRPVKQYSYKDDAYPGSTVSRTEYAVRPRTNSNVPSDGRRPMSMLVRNTSPTRRPVVSNSSRDDTLATRPAPYAVREEPPRYLIPSSTHAQGRDHHQRHYSATRADNDRLNVGSRVGGRAKGEYHPAGGYGQKSYSSNRASVKDDDYSYTGPREQFARDMQARAPPARESHSRRDRPLSVVEIPESKPTVPVRREMGPPPLPRQLERLDRPEDRRLSTRPIYEDERAADIPSRRNSVRAPVVHQLRDSGYASRDDVDIRPKSRRDRIEEEEPLPKLRTRDLERERDHPRDPERDREARDRDRERDREREPDRDRDREKDWERPRGHEKLKHADDRREIRSRDNSPERSGVGKGVATGLGGAAIAGLAGAALKGSSKPDDASDSDSRRERRHRKHKHRDRGDDETGPRELEPLERRPAAPVDDRGHDERSRPIPKPDESASESYEDEHQRRRHRRRKHKDRDDADTGDVLDPRSAAADPPRSDRELAEPEDDGRYRRRSERPSSRTREPEVPGLERRTVPPGEDEDARPRRVLLVEPEKKEEFKPRGILKAPRRVPFPEDPNPTREGVAPLKDVGKDGVPNGARWTKISRVLVNPEALEKAQERFEERDDYVIVLRVVTREEIQKFAEKTREIREEREKQWQEELTEKQKHKDSEHRPHHDGGGRRPRDVDDLSSGDYADKVAQPLLDQRPAVPGIDPRSLVNPAAVPQPTAPGGLPVPDIKLENHDIESANYSTNV